jgi:hypothetical protein
LKERIIEQDIPYIVGKWIEIEKKFLLKKGRVINKEIEHKMSSYKAMSRSEISDIDAINALHTENHVEV